MHMTKWAVTKNLPKGIFLNRNQGERARSIVQDVSSWLKI